MKIGYIRVSSLSQNIDRQLSGIELDKKFIDYASAKDTNRPQLNEMIGFIRDKDQVIVHSMDRLARNLSDLKNIVSTIIKKKASIFFVKENLIFDSEASPISLLLLNMLGSVAEFERSFILERQKEGIELAKKKNAFTGRRSKLGKELKQKVYNFYVDGLSITKIAKMHNLSRVTIYKIIKEFSQN